jgi:hypothetical protein
MITINSSIFLIWVEVLDLSTNSIIIQSKKIVSNKEKSSNFSPLIKYAVNNKTHKNQWFSKFKKSLRLDFFWIFRLPRPVLCKVVWFPYCCSLV